MPFQQMLTQLAQQRQGQGPAKGQANAAAKSGKAPGTPRAPQPRPQRAPMQTKPPMSTGGLTPGVAAPSMPMPGLAPTPLAQAPMAQPPMSPPSHVLPGIGAQPGYTPQPKPSLGGMGNMPPQGAQPNGLIQLLQLLAQKRQQAPQPNQNGGSSGEATVELPNSQF